MRFFTSVALVLTLSLASSVVHGELLIGLNSGNGLLAFDSATPGTISIIGTVTGLAPGDSLVGIDRRPSLGPNNGFLYAFGLNGGTGTARIYVLNESTAAATLVSTLAADPADATAPTPFTNISGSAFGVDFNPTVDRLRVISNTGQNLRINVDNGLTQLDVPLAYQTGDLNFGETPVDVAVAYSNNFGGATTTVLRAVDIGQSPDALVIHTNPNGGSLMTFSDLLFNSTSLTSYDISGLSGTPYFAVETAGGGQSSLYAGTLFVGTIGSQLPIIGIAAPVGTAAAVPEPATLTLWAIGALGCAIGAYRRRKRLA